MGGAKNSAENKQRMLNSTTFCGFLLTKSVRLRLSARIYHEVLKNVVGSLRNFRRKAGMFSILGGGKLSPSNR
jgi:hypothetical protein